ncbi:MAG: hypothetical protein K5986_03830 [Clostridium sp.]|uniref:DUF6115 domain-containing protein n=1 Tax=Clostridium sp. DSM 8431 TaxID=1761781 RepID=UPI0008E6B5F2|nr:hypothetical protein [Clostridium sp. DSM 8431]MCR4943580.1 hypothetical protein [Clostridium sp.]SFU31094.1 hypothetical protein SAMN04487886_100529 [Clostridium sp. DSM 8431]
MPLLIILIGIILIVVNYQALKKNKGSFSNVYDNKKNDLTDIDMKIVELRKEMAESLLELQQEILELKETSVKDDNFKDVKNSKIESDKKNEKDYLLTTENGVINDIRFKNKTQQIKELLDMGLNEDQICEKLSLGKGEVQLVKGLFKK